MEYARLFAELRQRKIVQTIIVYVGGSWGVLQALSLLQSTFGWPLVVMDVALLVLACGLAVAATVAWYHGEKGHQRVQRSELAILSLVGVVAVLGGWGLATRPAPATPAKSDPPTASPPSERTIVVMPFVVNARDSSLAWLQKGVAEMLTTDLAQVPELRVVSGQRVFDLLRQEGAAQAAIVAEPVAVDVAHKATAAYIVRGAVFRSGLNFRLDAELVSAADGGVEVSAHAVGRDIFSLVDSLASRLSRRLVPSAPPKGTAAAPLAQVATGSLDAYREYHEGLAAEHGLRGADAIQHYRRALALDSTFPLALLHLGAQELGAGDSAGALVHLGQARAQLGPAPARDRHLAGALLQWVRQDVPAATAALEQLTRREPDDKDAWLWLARAYALDPGHGADAEGALQHVLRLDPSYAPAYGRLAREHARRGDYAGADSLARQYIALQPGEAEPLDTRGEILETAGRYADARASYQAALKLRPDFARALTHLARLGARSGRIDEARADIAPYLGAPDTAVRVVAAVLTADLLLWRGQVDQALAILQRSSEEGGSVHPERRLDPLGRLVALWQLLGRPERVLRALEPLERAGLDPYVLQYAAALGELRRTDEIVALRTRLARVVDRLDASGPTPGTLEDLDAYVAYYHRDWVGAVERFRAGKAARRRPANVMEDPREVLALLGSGRGAEAVPLVQGMDSASLGDPILRHQALYLQARVYEAVGRGSDAGRDYQLLLRDWGPVIARFPQLRDVPERLARLGR